jgi:hypothetical protein
MTPKVEIPSIHHVIRSGFGNEFVEDPHVVPLPVGDLDERGDVPPQIQKGVEFDGGLPFAESRPREKGKAQVDRRGVEGVHRLLQFHRKGIVDVQVPGGPDQDLGEVGVDAPVAVSESSTCWLNLVLSRVPANSLPEVVYGDMLEQLREDGLPVVHGPSLRNRNATGYPGVEIGYGEYVGYHHDSKMLFGSASSNIGTAVKKW